MKLPIIKHLVNFAEANDVDYLHETLELLENYIELDSLKDEELDVIGELMSNISGAIEVYKLISKGESKSKALNSFMSRVLGSIDK